MIGRVIIVISSSASGKTIDSGVDRSLPVTGSNLPKPGNGAGIGTNAEDVSNVTSTSNEFSGEIVVGRASVVLGADSIGIGDSGVDSAWASSPGPTLKSCAS